MTGVHDMELVRINKAALKDQLPNGLHMMYSRHKKEAERWTSLVFQAQLSQQRMANLKAKRKREKEEAKAKAEARKHVEQFKAKMEVIATKLGVTWKELSNQSFTLKLLKDISQHGYGFDPSHSLSFSLCVALFFISVFFPPYMMR